MAGRGVPACAHVCSDGAAKVDVGPVSPQSEAFCSFEVVLLHFSPSPGSSSPPAAQLLDPS